MDWSVSYFLMVVVAAFIFSSPAPCSHKGKNSNFMYISVNKWSASSTEMHEYNPFYYASNNCTCNSLKSCYNAWASPERAFVMVISNTDLRSAVTDWVLRAQGPSLHRTSVEEGEDRERLTQALIWILSLSLGKSLQAKYYLITAELCIVRRLSGIAMFMPSSLNQKEKEAS